MTAADSKKTSLRRRTVLTAAAAIAMIGFAGQADAYVRADPVDLQVVDRDTGRVLRLWRHHGRLFVAGATGARYSLRVANHSNGRVLVVLSIDGVNILTGETADYGQRGYVFSPHETGDLSGWRKSDTQIAAFTFAPLPQSYAARTGRPADVGVIGMAVFRERIPYPVAEPEASQDYERFAQPRSAPSSPFRSLVAPSPVPPPPPSPVVAAPAQRAGLQPPNAGANDKAAGEFTARRQDERLGTAHGAREWSVVTTVPFERATAYPQSVRRIEYDSYANLVASGVIPSRSYPDHRPQPFPAHPGEGGYVPDPPPEPWDDER